MALGPTDKSIRDQDRKRAKAHQLTQKWEKDQRQKIKNLPPHLHLAIKQFHKYGGITREHMQELEEHGLPQSAWSKHELTGGHYDRIDNPDFY